MCTLINAESRLDISMEQKIRQIYLDSSKGEGEESGGEERGGVGRRGGTVIP